jgi:hypothetical protein
MLQENRNFNNGGESGNGLRVNGCATIISRRQIGLKMPMCCPIGAARTADPRHGSAGGSVEHATLEAVQIDPTADLVTSSAPAGAPLATSAGVWSWGPIVAGRLIVCNGCSPADYVIYLKGSQVGAGSLMEVAHGGQLYANTSSSGWFVWNGTQFVSSPAP